jgi:hypothetical protein
MNMNGNENWNIKNRNYGRIFRNRTLLKATSTKARSDGKVRIVLYWRPVTAIVGYNLYRKALEETEMPGKPLNGDKPIGPVKDGAALEAIIPRGSTEWALIQNAFTTLRDQASSSIRFRLPVDPAQAVDRGLTREEEELFELLAFESLPIRIAKGLGFIDDDVKNDKWYVYELRGIRANGSEIPLTEEFAIQAGHFQLPRPPSGIKAIPGDSKVLILWNRNDFAYSYNARRAVKYSTNVFSKINAAPISFDIESDLDGNPIKPQPGFLDFQRWDDEGYPSAHIVDGQSIYGPLNHRKYYYQVASVDILGRVGSWSSAYLAIPQDKTPPMSPRDLTVDFSTNPPGLALSWRKVTYDVEGHVEQDSSHTYKIYRSKVSTDLERIETLPYPVHKLTSIDPADPSTMVLSWLDDDPAIFPQYGEQDMWYIVRCEDEYGNISAPSALIKGKILDITPPGPTKMVDSEGYARHIRIMWAPNPEPDIGGYQIYRTLCDHGQPYRPKFRGKDDVAPCDFALIGEILLEEAQRRLSEAGVIYYDDYSVPEGSPLCYAYWVRAFDMNRNLYQGYYGCPQSPDEYVCQRLYEETPPPVPVISALKAKNNSVLIKWIASPIQDLRAFHIYRSEKEYDSPVLVGCVLSDGTPWPGPWEGEKPKCIDIPAEPNPDTVEGEFRDTKVEPNKVYWYRVSALDWLGNESEGAEVKKIPAVSTFTYSLDVPDKPTVLPYEYNSTEKCGLLVKWKPNYDSNLIEGFVVFRSTAPNGPYRQVSPIIQGNEFSDTSAIKKTKYLYSVQAIDKHGKLSTPSDPVPHEY